MLTYCLQRTPAAEELGPTAQAYADSLARQGYSDAAAQRAHDALLYLADRGDEWPTPNQVAARMRAAAAEQARQTVRLVHLPTPERRVELREQVAAVRDALRAPAARPTGSQPRRRLSSEEEAALLETARKQYADCSTEDQPA